MDQTVLSAQLDLSEWETDHSSPLGFLSLGSDKGGLLPLNKSGQTGLDFAEHVDQEDCEEALSDNALNVDNLLRTSGYFCGDHILELERSDAPTGFQSIHFEELKPVQQPDVSDDITDEITLSWLFNPGSSDLLREDSPCEHLKWTQGPSVKDANAWSCEEPSSLEQISERTPGTRADTSSLLVDLLSSKHSCSPPLSPVCSGEAGPHGVTEELLLHSQDEQGGLPPSLLSQGGERVSPETEDKGSVLEAVSDLPLVSNVTLAGLFGNSLQQDTVITDCCSAPASNREEFFPLLDSEVPVCDESPSLCPTNLTSLTCKGALLDSPAEEPGGEHASIDLSKDTTSEEPGEGELSAPCPSANPVSTLEELLPAVPPDGDAPVQGDLPNHLPSAENDCMDLMEENHLSESQHERDCSMALELGLTADEVHHEETLHSKLPEAEHSDWSTDLQVERHNGEKDEERPTDLNLRGHSDLHVPDALDFPAQELSRGSSETGWTAEQSVEAVSLSEMVVPDSVPVVSSGDQRAEDTSPLKAVFDALDQDGDGFVRIEEFMEFAAAYGADQVKDLTKFLDPSGLGVISFEDFHRGISAISNGGPEPQVYDVHYSPEDGAVGCPEEYDEQNEVTDSAYLGSESTYSECETFTDEDTGALVPPEMHEDVETDSGIEATLHDPEEGGNSFSLSSDLHNHSLVTVIGGEEEHFEDFGESNTSELLLLEANGEETVGEVDPSVLQTPEQVNGPSLLLTPSTPAPLPDCFQSFLREEALDFFCSQCHKQISRLEDLSTRLNFLEMTSSGKRLSSKKVARHLLQNTSMTLDTMSDLTRDILEMADNDITDKVLLLERRVAELEKESEASGEQHARLRQENLQLVHRANALEEQLKEQELYAEEHLQQETRRHKEAINKLEREMGLEVENLQARLQLLDEENSELRSCVPCLRANIERLEEEKRKLQDETEDMTDRLNEEMESCRKMADKLSHERHQNQKEKESTQELIEDLRKQLEHLQLFKLEAEAKRGRCPGAGLQEYQTRTREVELEQEIKRLKQDNRSLKEQNDELNGQIINLSIQGAKNLMSAPFSDSLAAEINSVSRAELMEAIHKQEEINYRLQDYIDKIIVAIMESNPSILEVK